MRQRGAATGAKLLLIESSYSLPRPARPGRPQGFRLHSQPFRARGNPNHFLERHFFLIFPGSRSRSGCPSRGPRDLLAAIFYPGRGTDARTTAGENVSVGPRCKIIRPRPTRKNDVLRDRVGTRACYIIFTATSCSLLGKKCFDVWITFCNKPLSLALP